MLLVEKDKKKNYIPWSMEIKKMHLIFRCLASLSINNSRNTLIYTFIWDEKKMSCSRNSHIFICIRSLQNTAHDRFIHYQSGKAKPW